DRAATGDLPLPQSQLVSESQYFFELSHGQPFRGQCWFPPLTSGTLMPALLSSVLRPAPSRTVHGLWNSFRNDPGQGSGHRRKVTGLRSESVTGFIPESCPASFRNGARNDFGIVPGLPRNPQSYYRLLKSAILEKAFAFPLNAWTSLAEAIGGGPTHSLRKTLTGVSGMLCYILWLTTKVSLSLP